MTINIADAEIILSFAEEMASYGKQYVAFNVAQVTDCDTIEFFRTSPDAQEYCLVMTNEADYFESLPTESLIRDLNALLQSGIDTSCNEAIDLTAFAQRERDKKELLQNNLNITIMNEKNLEFLKDQLKYTGFGETFESVLKENMHKGEKEFKLEREGVYGTDTMTAVLNFKKSDQSDMYFFNSYHVSLKKEQAKETMEQTFYINSNNSNITLKEAYNLMEGRAVNKDLKTKEGESYNSWIQMDFKVTDDNGSFKLNHYHQNYGYDLEASLAKHSIKELDTPKYKEDLLNSLKKGNLQSVTFVVNGVESKKYVEANPHFKTINVYDNNMQRINHHRESKDQKQSESPEKTVGKETRQNQDAAGDEPETGKENKQRKGKSKSL